MRTKDALFLFYFVFRDEKRREANLGMSLSVARFIILFAPIQRTIYVNKVGARRGQMGSVAKRGWLDC